MECSSTGFIKTILILTLGFCFALHVSSDLVKFFNRDTIVTSSSTELKNIDYPAVVLCPQNPFKISAMDELGLHRDFWIFQKLSQKTFKAPKSREEINYWWNKSTIQPGTFIKEVRNVVSYKDLSRRENWLVDDDITTEYIATLSTGRCIMYTFSHPYSGNPEQFIRIDLIHHKDIGNVRVIILNSADEKWKVAINGLLDTAVNRFWAQPDNEYVVGKLKLKRFNAITVQSFYSAIFST